MAKELLVLPLLYFMRLLTQKWNNNNRLMTEYLDFILSEKYYKIMQLNKEEVDKLNVSQMYCSCIIFVNLSRLCNC